jgi:AGZA family xanthine/uracil permease-like MFS transporter
MIALSQGFMLSAMVLAAMTVFIVERQFLRAAGWALAASALSMVGLIHAFELTAAGVQNKFGVAAAPMFGLMYFLAAVVLLILHVVRPADAGARECEEKGESDVGSEDDVGNQGGEARPRQA